MKFKPHYLLILVMCTCIAYMLYFAVSRDTKTTYQTVEVVKIVEVEKPYIEPIKILTQWDIDTMNLIKVLDFEEGFRSKPYLCSEDYVTVGLGTKLHKSKGMNPDDFPITVSRSQAEEWLHSDVAKVSSDLEHSPVGIIFKSLDNDKRAIVISMAYQMGYQGVLRFKKMWAALAIEDYSEAANQALDSRWATQTPERAMRHARVLSGETLDEVYN